MAETIKPILLCRENAIHVYPILGMAEVNTTLLSLRSRFNPDLEYFLLRIPPGVKGSPEAIIQSILDRPHLLDASNHIERL